MKLIPAGRYTIGTNRKNGVPIDWKGPAVTVELASFEIGATTVTNQAFAFFIDATGYVTEAERFGWSFVFLYFLDEATKAASKLAPNLPWWYAVAGADWRHPEGPSSTVADRMDHPVVQVSRNMRSPIANGQISVCQMKRNGKSLRRAELSLRNISMGGRIVS